MQTDDLWGIAPSSAQRALAEYMSELSEQGFYACWLIGVEFVLWRLADNPNYPGLWDCSIFTVANARRLRALSDACGGWVYWDDGIDGLAFADTERWRQICAARREIGLAPSA